MVIVWEQTKEIDMRNEMLKGLMLTLLVSVLASCAVNETATVTVSQGNVTQVIESNSGLLSDSLSISDTQTAYAGDMLKAQVSIKNDSSDDLSFSYKYKWLDKAGFEIAIDGRPWSPLTITAYETKSVQAVAPNPSATTFKIMVQN